MAASAPSSEPKTGKPVWAPFACAAVAATGELLLMQPLDVVKTRLHLQGFGVKTGDNFPGTWAAIQGIRRAEGSMGLWRGFVPGLCVVIPRRGFKFLFYDAFVAVLWKGDKGKAPFVHSMAAGSLAGGAEALVITPMECIKIAMQTEKAGSGTRPTGILAFAGAMIRTGGISSLYSGLAATVAKHMVHSCFYFATFHETKKQAPKGQVSRAENVGWDLVAGFAAGCAAATANNPFDVVKTRQQVGAASAVSSHAVAKEFSDSQRSLVRWMLDLVRAEGPRALYKGYVAKVARLGPGSAIIFTAYEQLMQLF